MALPALVKQELQALQTYYKSLYFLRWFLPNELKKQLNILEPMDLAHLHHNSQDFLTLSTSIIALQRSLSSASWSTRIMIYWLSGFHQFFQGELMQYTKVLEENNLIHTGYLRVALRSASLKQGVEGLLLHKATGIDRSLSLKNQHLPEQVNAILQVRQCNIPDVWKKRFYLAIAKSTASINFAECIKLLLPNRSCHAYIPTLAQSDVPSDLAQALLVLANHQLLPSFDSINPALPPSDLISLTLQKTIIDTIILSAEPWLLARAVVAVAPYGIVDATLFEALKTSEHPEELATLTKAFYRKGKLSLQIIPDLESHRKTLNMLAGQCNVGEQHKFDMAYCQKLAGWISQEGGLRSPYLFTIYDVWLPKFSESAELNKRFFKILNQLNQREIWQGPCNAAFSEFLTQPYSNSQFFLYADLLTILAKQPGFFTRDNHAAIFKCIQSCIKPDLLLLKCHSAAPATAHALQVMVLEIYDAQQPRVSPVQTSLPVSALPVMRHRKNSQEGDVENSITELNAPAKSPDFTKKKPAVSPASSSGGWGVLGAVAGTVAGFTKQLIWSEPEDMEKKSEAIAEQPSLNNDFANMV